MQVKSVSSSTFVLIQKKYLEGKPRPDLYFAVVLVPPPHVPQPFVFHILTHTEVCEILQSLQRTEEGRTALQGRDGRLNLG